MMLTCAPVVAAALIIALRDWRATRSPLLLFILLSGAVAVIVEPLLDILGACYFPVTGQNRLFEPLGRAMPVWQVFAYTAMFGVVPMMMVRSWRGGVSTQSMWLWIAIPTISDFVLEEVLQTASRSTMYLYYGDQPLRLHIFPLSWVAVNALGITCPAVLLSLSLRRLRGWQTGLALLAVPFCHVPAFAMGGFHRSSSSTAPSPGSRLRRAAWRPSR